MEERKAKLYYTENTFEPMYVQVGNDWIDLGDSPLKFFDADQPDPDTKPFKEKEFTYLPPEDPNNMLAVIVAAANAKAAELKLAAEEEEEEDEEEEEEEKKAVVDDSVDVTAVADPVSAKRAANSEYKISHFLTPAMIAKINQAIKVKSYTLADDGKTMTKSFGDRTITIHENGGMSSNPITTGTREKVAAILADDLIAIFRNYAILYNEGKDAALPDGIINLRINHKGLSIAQERAHILLVNDVRERFYAELKRTPNAYPDAFLKKFKFDGDEIRVDLKRKAVVAPDATPDAKKPAATPAPAATSQYLSKLITKLEKDPNDKDAKDLLISILNGNNTLIAAEGNVVKPKENKTDPKDQAALTKAVGLLQDMLSKYGYAITINKKADDSIESVLLPESGTAMAQAIESGAKKVAAPVAPAAPVPPVSPGRSGRI